MSNFGWTKADREADEERYRQRKQAEAEKARAEERKVGRVAVWALLVGVAILVAGFFAVRALTAEPDGAQLASALDAEIRASGEAGSGALSAYAGARDDRGGSVAVTTTLFDKTENEEVAQRICSALTTFRLRDGLEDLGQVRILSSADTTLAYCD